jgi:hypothetical protein
MPAGEAAAKRRHAPPTSSRRRSSAQAPARAGALGILLLYTAFLLATPASIARIGSYLLRHRVSRPTVR